jgi:prolyl-tRNA synthetase
MSGTFNKVTDREGKGTPIRKNDITNGVSIKNVNNSAQNIDLYTIKQNWNKLLTDIRPYNHSLSALLSNCLPVSVKGNTITLATAYGFYSDKLNDEKNRLTVEEVFSKVIGCPIQIEVTIDKGLAVQKEVDSPAEKPKDQDNLLDSALEIMGGKVVE